MNYTINSLLEMSSDELKKIAKEFKLEIDDSLSEQKIALAILQKQNRPENDKSENDKPDNDKKDDAKIEDSKKEQKMIRKRTNNKNGSSNNKNNYQKQNKYTDSNVETKEVEFEGILDVRDKYGFIRLQGYMPDNNDVYISPNEIRTNGLRPGDFIKGTVDRPVEPTDKKNNAIKSVISVNGGTIEDAKNRVIFNRMTPLYPDEQLKLETENENTTGRIIDLISPIGKGQRGMIVSPPKAGKTIMMQTIANSITKNNPNVHLMVVLVDERPEEVTDFARNIQGEVIASTFDKPPIEHTWVAELAIERAKRLVEMGQDVVVLLDGITRLARAYNLSIENSNRLLSGGLDVGALYPPKKFFGAARNIENGGSLTILATALIETGSKMDEVIFEEFKGTGNMEIRLSRELANKRLFPAIDVDASGTRREEFLLPPAELKVIWQLRKLLSTMEPEQALDLMLKHMKKTNNAGFLTQISRTTNT
jgi:transcription termination factor Rho